MLQVLQDVFRFGGGSVDMYVILKFAGHLYTQLLGGCYSVVDFDSAIFV